MSAHALTLVRHEWEDGARRLEAERGDPRRYARLVQQLEIVTDELRKRVGGVYTLGELAQDLVGGELGVEHEQPGV